MKKKLFETLLTKKSFPRFFIFFRRKRHIFVVCTYIKVYTHTSHIVSILECTSSKKWSCNSLEPRRSVSHFNWYITQNLDYIYIYHRHIRSVRRETVVEAIKCTLLFSIRSETYWRKITLARLEVGLRQSRVKSSSINISSALNQRVSIRYVSRRGYKL